MSRASTPGFVLRVANSTDIPALFAVRTSVRENHLDIAQLALRGVTAASVAQSLENKNARTWVVEEPDNVIGFCMADAETGSVFALFVRPGSEGRGYGRALLNAAEQWLFDAGWDTIWLNTGHEPHFRAHRFYQSSGWRLAGQADHDDVRYEKQRLT